MISSRPLFFRLSIDSLRAKFPLALILGAIASMMSVEPLSAQQQFSFVQTVGPDDQVIGTLFVNNGVVQSGSSINWFAGLPFNIPAGATFSSDVITSQTGSSTGVWFTGLRDVGGAAPQQAELTEIGGDGGYPTQIVYGLWEPVAVPEPSIGSLFLLSLTAVGVAAFKIRNGGKDGCMRPIGCKDWEMEVGRGKFEQQSR